MNPIRRMKRVFDTFFIDYNRWTKSFESDKNYMDILQKIPESPVNTSSIALSLVKPKSAVLSAGCGAGREVKYLTEILNCKVTAIDCSQKMVSLSKINAPNAKYLLGDMVKFRSPEKFDYIVCIWNTINFIPTFAGRKQFIKNCYENLKEEGRLILTTSHRYSHWRSFLHFIIYANKNYYPSPKQIERWFEGTQFKIYKTRIDSNILIYARKEKK